MMTGHLYLILTTCLVRITHILCQGDYYERDAEYDRERPGEFSDYGGSRRYGRFPTRGRFSLYRGGYYRYRRTGSYRDRDFGPGEDLGYGDYGRGNGGGYDDYGDYLYDQERGMDYGDYGLGEGQGYNDYNEYDDYGLGDEHTDKDYPSERRRYVHRPKRRRRPKRIYIIRRKKKGRRKYTSPKKRRRVAPSRRRKHPIAPRKKPPPKQQPVAPAGFIGGKKKGKFRSARLIITIPTFGMPKKGRRK